MDSSPLDRRDASSDAAAAGRFGVYPAQGAYGRRRAWRGAARRGPLPGGSCFGVSSSSWSGFPCERAWLPAACFSMRCYCSSSLASSDWPRQPSVWARLLGGVGLHVAQELSRPGIVICQVSRHHIYFPYLHVAQDLHFLSKQMYPISSSI
jgi:hypothetical protein